jgi:hypothetical protein
MLDLDADRADVELRIAASARTVIIEPADVPSIFLIDRSNFQRSIKIRYAADHPRRVYCAA